ncbi:hypothetical protein CEK29_00535 [Bordetella genomosp. 5]|uniref:hypothetical protein n=1 Tax=Bordetella genomosp. 5 TaxID=1395608 RepID=UPI000B9E243F|nr:hypothetical protein [Bordetella genomosp. 5]OZI47279.1 hypothetical protein CEK29_00535 [Bordetella genomosp. 5]
MAHDFRQLLTDWLGRMSGDASPPWHGEQAIAPLSLPGQSEPFYLVHPPGPGETFILVAPLGEAQVQVSPSVLSAMLELNAEPALSSGAFALDPSDKSAIYRFVGDLTGMDFARFQNTLTNFGLLAAEARRHYQHLVGAASRANRLPGMGGPGLRV